MQPDPSPTRAAHRDRAPRTAYPRATSPRALALALLAVLAVLAGCGGGGEEGSAGDGGGTGAGETQVTPPPSEPEEPKVVRSDSLRSLGVGDDTSEKPEFKPPEGSPPKELQIYDVKEGDGAEATAGRPVSMQYVGKSFSTGEEFDASWDRGEAFPFTLGGGEVIPGWDLGIEGMREGGRRIMVIPAELAYGDQGSPPTIKPNETLVFVVDLEKVGQ
jgi:peptidylprolyl isomerase